MPEEIKPDIDNSEVNLNLKLPENINDGAVTFKDLVLTVYTNKRLFLIWTCIGAVLGIIAAAGVFIWRGGSPSAPVEIGDSKVSISVVLNYSEPTEHIFPDGSAFNEGVFYSPALWQNAIDSIGRSDLTPADVMSSVNIEHVGSRDNLDELIEIIRGLPDDYPANTFSILISNYLLSNPDFTYSGNKYMLTIPAGSGVFSSDDEKKQFLQAFCGEFINYIVSEYYSDSRLGTNQGQFLGDWVDITGDIIVWDSFDYYVNFRLLADRYTELAEVLDSIYAKDPIYVTPDGKSFDQYAEELQSIIYADITPWIVQTQSDVYIRNLDRFADEFSAAIALKRTKHQYYLDLTDLYNESLGAFRSAAIDNGIGTEESFDLFLHTQELAIKAAELNKEVNRLEFMYEALLIDGIAIRNRSRDAETALSGFIADLEATQAELYDVISDYYLQRHQHDADSAVIVTSPTAATIASSGGLGMMGLVLVAFAFIACVGMCIIMAFIVVAVKKHLRSIGN